MPLSHPVTLNDPPRHHEIVSGSAIHEPGCRITSRMTRGGESTLSATVTVCDSGFLHTVRTRTTNPAVIGGKVMLDLHLMLAS